MQRTANAEWKGGLKDGEGKVSTGTGTLRDVGYGFRDRFEDGSRTNPEELIAAAHAACFSMALSGELGKESLTAESIRTTANLTFEKTEPGFTITGIHLDVKAKVPNADPQKFQQAAENAKKGCPISRALNTTITMTAQLETSMVTN